LRGEERVGDGEQQERDQEKGVAHWFQTGSPWDNFGPGRAPHCPATKGTTSQKFHGAGSSIPPRGLKAGQSQCVAGRHTEVATRVPSRAARRSSASSRGPATTAWRKPCPCSTYLGHRGRLPGAVEDRRRCFLRPVHAQHWNEFALGR